LAIDEPDFDSLAAAVFKKLLAALDRADPDVVEADGTPDMVTITASNGEKVIVNTQRAVEQIWVAGKGEGLHFSLEPSSRRWLDDRGRGLELSAFIAACVREACGVELAL
jgi:CyaY protein